MELPGRHERSDIPRIEPAAAQLPDAERAVLICGDPTR
jgi:hypothetical protein